MRMQHVIITQFCYRQGGVRAISPTKRIRRAVAEARSRGRRVLRPRQHRLYDPVRRANVEHRLRLLEITAFASLMAQTEQDFDWVLIVDARLAPDLRARVEELVHRRDRTHLHVFDERDQLARSDWLEPYHPRLDPGDYLVTTKMDDDDALPRNYVEELHRSVRRVIGSGSPPLMVLGGTDLLNWDLVLTEAAPLGTHSSWHRRDPRGARVAATGFSLAARQPEYPFAVLGKNHMLARDLLDFEQPVRHPKVAEIRQLFHEAADAAGDDLTRYPADETFVDLSETTGPVILTNHRLNLQQSRVLEPKPGEAPVQGPETFPATEIDWAALDRHADHFRISPYLRLRRARWQFAAQVERAVRRLRSRLRG